MHQVLRQLNNGDWFVLSMICKNVDSQWFQHLLIELFKNLRKVQLERRSLNGSSGNRERLSNFQTNHSGDERMLEHSDT